MYTPDDSTDKFKTHLQVAQLNNDQDQIILLCDELVNIYQKKGEFALCANYCKMTLPYFSDPEQMNELARRNLFIGNCHSLLADSAVAEEFYQTSLLLYQETKSDFGRAEVHLNLGKLFRNIGNYQQSLSHLGDALAIYNKDVSLLFQESQSRVRHFYINAIETSGIVYAQLDQKERAREYMLQALHLKQQYCKPCERVSTLINLGASYSDENTDKALDFYLQSLRLLEDDSPFFLKVSVLNNIGGCLEDKGDYVQALEHYEKALQFLIDSGQVKYRSKVLKHIGTVQYKQGNNQEALKSIEQSLQLSQQENAQDDIMDCYLTISNIWDKMNDLKAALAYRVKYDEVKDQVFHSNLSSQLADLQKKYEETSRSLDQLKQEKSLISETVKKSMKMSFIGVSDSIKEICKLATSAAEHPDARVLITGESGVGKEIIARLIHYTSIRNNAPFIDVNCCSVPETMAEGDLFGYTKGAFTGAVYNKAGFLEEANNGTLFLDEIADMPMEIQAKLLRVLETKQFKRLGSNKLIHVDFRLISATNRDINDFVKQNRFRSDLLYRINTVEIHIPPLRERKEDIEPLLDHFLSEFAKAMKKPIPRYSKSLLNCLYDYDFPGNVRELKNLIEKAMIYLKNNELHVSDFHLPSNPIYSSVQVPMVSNSFKLVERESQILLDALSAHNGNQTLAAQALGISYSTFKRRYKKIRES